VIEKRSSDKSRTWALRDRGVVPINRTRARAMRAEPTIAERKLWWHLRHRLVPPASHFRRQVHLGHYIVDFANHRLKVIVEIDGGQHAEQSDRDARRTKFLEAEGYCVLRFWNNDVLGNIDGVLEMIQSSILATPTPAPPHKGEGKARTP
jgi:very-short-patch-repair endonuclease